MSYNPNGGFTDRRQFSSRQQLALECTGFVGAEFVSAVAGIGAVAIADVAIPKYMLKFASKCVAKCVVEPFLDPIEAGLSKICKLEECQVDKEKPRAERAESLAKTMIVFGGAYAASMYTKLKVRRMWNKHFGINSDDKIIKPAADASFWQKTKHYATFQHFTPQERLIFAMDEGVHLGSLYLLNNTLAPYTDEAIKTTTGLIQKVTGCSEKKAHEVASMTWVWEAANVMGALSGMAVIAGNHSFDLSRKLGRLLSGDKSHSTPGAH